MSEKLSEMKIVEEKDVEEIVDETTSEEVKQPVDIEGQHESRQKQIEEEKQRFRDRADELSKEIEKTRMEIFEKKYPLSARPNKPVEGDVTDYSVYDDMEKYLIDLRTFLEEDAKWKGSEFDAILRTHEHVDNHIKHYEEDKPVEMDFTFLETLFRIIYSTDGVGVNQALDREYIFRPINNTYHLYQDDIIGLNQLNDEYTQIINIINDPRF